METFWKALLATTSLLLVSAPTQAFIITDGSGAGIDPAVLSAVLAVVADEFADPEAVQFRRVRLANRPDMICGEVNAKNSFGAYVGFEPFYSLGIDRSQMPPPQIGVISIDCR